jgi:hypothetical protein
VDDNDGPLECIWLEGNSTTNPAIAGRCELKVLFALFTIFLFFCINRQTLTAQI